MRVLIRVLGVLLTAVASTAEARQYRLLDLGSLGGHSTTARGVTGDGIVAGTSKLQGNGAEHAFRGTPGALLDLGTLGGLRSQAYGSTTRAMSSGSRTLLRERRAMGSFIMTA